MPPTTQVSEFARGVSQNAAWDAIKLVIWFVYHFALIPVSALIAGIFLRRRRQRKKGSTELSDIPASAGDPYDVLPSDLTPPEREAVLKYLHHSEKLEVLQKKVAISNRTIVELFAVLGLLGVFTVVIIYMHHHRTISVHVFGWLLLAEAITIFHFGFFDPFAVRTGKFFEWPERKRRNRLVIAAITMLGWYAIVLYWLLPFA